MTNRTFSGLCVLALESRRAREIAKLITNLGGVAIVAPSVREVPLESNQEAVQLPGAWLPGRWTWSSLRPVSELRHLHRPWRVSVHARNWRGI